MEEREEAGSAGRARVTLEERLQGSGERQRWEEREEEGATSKARATLEESVARLRGGGMLCVEVRYGEA